MRLLLVGQAARTSGYARVLRSLAPRLAREFDVSYFTLNTRTPMNLPEVDCVAPSRVSDPFGFAQLPEVLADRAPDVVLACHDANVLAHYARLVRRHRPTARLILYVALEFDELYQTTAQDLCLADELVCYTRTAAQWLAGHLGAHVPGARHPNIRVLPHGLDAGLFGPIGPDGAVSGTPAARSVARSTARAMLGLPGSGPLILNANRDTPRKRLEVAVQAFAGVAAALPDARLVLLHGAGQRAQARELGIDDRLIVPDQQPDDATLNLYFNAADVGFNTCTAEGWGLVAMEHARAGVAQVMPGHPALREIWGSSVVFVSCQNSAVAGFGPTSASDHARAVADLIARPSLRERLGRAARDVAASPALDWDVIARRWSDVLSGEPTDATGKPELHRR